MKEGKTEKLFKPGDTYLRQPIGRLSDRQRTLKFKVVSDHPEGGILSICEGRHIRHTSFAYRCWHLKVPV